MRTGELPTQKTKLPDYEQVPEHCRPLVHLLGATIIAHRVDLSRWHLEKHFWHGCPEDLPTPMARRSLLIDPLGTRILRGILEENCS
jgi:hypothetical protein